MASQRTRAVGATRPSKPKSTSKFENLRPVDGADLPTLTRIITNAPWFTKGRPGVLVPGALTREPLAIPERDAQRLLRDVVRLVADLPIGASPNVVWQLGDSELEVDSSATTISCAEGLVTINVFVNCDQLEKLTPISVPIAVGTAKAPTGLVMSSLTKLRGPEVVTRTWSDAIVAFAWESLVEVSRRVTGELQRDKRSKSLVPGGIAASKGVLIIQPMARHAGEQ